MKGFGENLDARYQAAEYRAQLTRAITFVLDGVVDEIYEHKNSDFEMRISNLFSRRLRRLTQIGIALD